VQVRKEKSNKEEKSQKVYISRMHEATPGGHIANKLGKFVGLADVVLFVPSSL